jgi:hypothetical protein
MIRTEHKYMLLLARADGLGFGPRSPSLEYITEWNLLSEYNFVVVNISFLIPISIQTNIRPAISTGLLTSSSGLKTLSASFLGATQASPIPKIDVPNANETDHRDLHLELSSISPHHTAISHNILARGQPKTQGARCKAACLYLVYSRCSHSPYNTESQPSRWANQSAAKPPINAPHWSAPRIATFVRCVIIQSRQRISLF